MEGSGHRETKWIAVLCVLGALLGAFIAAQVNQPVITEADWIEAIQSADPKVNCAKVPVERNRGFTCICLHRLSLRLTLEHETPRNAANFEPEDGESGHPRDSMAERNVWLVELFATLPAVMRSRGIGGSSGCDV
jgi:hypothetical protein